MKSINRQYTIVHDKLSSPDCNDMPQQEFIRLGKEYSILGGQFELVQEQEACLQAIHEFDAMTIEENKKYIISFVVILDVC